MITAKGLAEAGPTQVGSMICLPPPAPFLKRGMQVLPNACDRKEWFAEVAMHAGLNGDRSPDVLFGGLLNHYGHIQGQHRREPTWTRRIPSTVLHEIRRRHAINGSEEIIIEHSGGVRFCAPRGSLFAESEKVFNFERLSGIAQLSTLRVPVSSVASPNARSQPMRKRFSHTRVAHCRRVAGFMTLMASNLLHEQVAPATVSAVGHDTLTAAGGDMTHALDREAFNEDLHFAKLLKRSDFQTFLQHWNLPGELIVSTVAGQGVLGDMNDAADKLGYVGLDADHYLAAVRENLPLWYPDGFLAIEGMIIKHPEVCRIWESARIREGQLVFEDSAGLAAFLRLRMLLFRWLYNNPLCLCWEHALAESFLRPMYTSGFITREQLWSHDDQWLSLKMDAFLERTPRFRSGLLEDLEPFPFGITFEQYPTKEAAVMRARTFNDDLSKTTVVDEMTPVTKTGAKRFRVVENGKVKTFAEAFSRQADELETLLHGEKLVSVAILDLRELGVHPSMWSKVKRLH